MLQAIIKSRGTWVLLASNALLAKAATVRSPTPPMGWNSYNSYSCSPSEDIIKKNAQSLVSLGLADLGYTTVTVDCGWPAEERDADGKLQWDSTKFPSGVTDLATYIHGLELKFGLYSGAGYLQCGSTTIPASLGYEAIDAETFAAWGGDSLKYDNCYATSKTAMSDADSDESKAATRFQKMATSLDAVSRDIAYYICQWGIGTDLGDWASAIGNTWRISNDIYGAWRSVWRITNQAIPYYKHTKPGAFPDLDMLIVGLGALSNEEERFHFGMWAIHKSPLVIGAALDTLPTESRTTLSNKEVIAINQDSLGKQAQLVVRHTEEEWDLWAGELSGSRTVVGISNWRNASQTVQVDLGLLNVSVATARDVWAQKDLGHVTGFQAVALGAHEMKLWVLSDITKAVAPEGGDYYSAAKATLGGSAAVTTCGVNCLPTNSKVSHIAPGASVTFGSVSTSASGTLLLGVDYINFDYSFADSFQWGTNTRNMTVSVNGGTAKRWAFPISGGDWWETGRMTIAVDGFVRGSTNKVVFSVPASDAWAPDLVGFQVLG